MMRKAFVAFLVFGLGASALVAQGPEPAGWYAGDMHVHRSCGGSPESLSSMYGDMSTNNLAVISLLADMGNGEVQDPTTDLPLVNGQDASISSPGRIVHWDTEWHWDPTYYQYPHQALGGHIVALGLSSAQQIWQEYTYPILTWAHQQGGIAGFAHMQYLDGNFPSTLTCCSPVEYPVEVALGAADFISEDVADSGSVFYDSGTSVQIQMNPEVAIQAYYKLLNTGFRPSFAAGTDYPCNSSHPLGNLLTYAQPAGGQMTYANWINAIKNGRTVVSRNGHDEFMSLTVNGSATPGDEVDLATAGAVQVSIQWSVSKNLSGTIELVNNGVVVASKTASAAPGSPATWTGTVNFPRSGWLAARRMGADGHQVHTGAVFVIVNGAPIRASATDAQYYVNWMTTLLANTSPGGVWNSFFPTSLSAAQARYQAAKALYQQIGLEAQGSAPTLSSITVTPANQAIAPGTTQQFTATGNYSNGTSLNITGQVVWASSNPSVVNINLRGLAAAINPGTAVISATLGSVSGSTAITVQIAPLVVTTQSLPAGAVNTAYSATLAASGGTLQYTWSIASGSLPNGLSLNSSTGAITGTATTAGTFNFTAQVTDSGSPKQSATKALSIVISAAGGGACPCTIWLSTTAPALADSGPDSAVEIGVKFRADSDGYITAIRFYKGTGNTGTHVGNMWTSGGTKLATATFTNETSSGWQQASFSSPVAIKANTVYVASYHTNVGHYADDENYFTTGVDRAPLHAPADGVSGFNGVYAYGSSSTFPSQGWNSSNYWVDVVFAPAGPDTTPPTVMSFTPSNGASGVATNATVTVTFSEALDSTTINGQTFQLLDPLNAVVPAAVTYDGSSYTATLAPTSALLNSASYTAVIKGGATDPRVKDVSGNGLASNFTWSFTTAAPPPPPPNDGPGGPILIVSSSSNPFSRYYSEILRAEGLNEFTAMDISLVSSATLSNYDIVVLGDIPLTSAQVGIFSDWVNLGGNLIAMHPDKQLAGLLGLSNASATLPDAYLVMNTSSGPAKGLVGESIQYHGSADLYALNGASSLATLYSNAFTPSSYPAVTLRMVGVGQAAAFTYDLARAVVYTRQGNPAWRGEARGGTSPIRSDDLFFGDASFDPQPDWVDFGKIAIPQADEQQRLLANLILQMNLPKKPLPRFWYLPRGLKAAVVMTGDDHGSFYSGGATAARFNQYLADSPAGCSVADWQCVRATSYVFPPVVASNPLTNAQAASYISQGFEIGVHVDSDPDCSDWTPAALDSAYTNDINSFRSKYTSAPAPQTHRMHCISWSDYDTQPQVELSHGIRLDTTYYYWPDSWINDRPGMFTGSGMPMRYAKRDGTIIDVYQATTQMTDESGQSYPYHIDALLDGALGPGGYYGVFTANMHNDVANSAGSDAIVASAQSRGIPIVSAKQMLTWLDGRNGSSFSSLSRSGNLLSFTIQVGSGANGLYALLPANAASGALSGISLNGSPIAYTLQTIKGVVYAVFPAAAGNYVADYSGTPWVTVSSVALSPSSVTGGNPSTGTVTLTGPAPTGGAAVAMTSADNAVAAVPATVTISSGETSANFAVNTSAVASATVVAISGKYNGTTASAGLTVTPILNLSSVSLSPSTLTGGSSSTGTVLLNTPPSADTPVSLQSSDTTSATVPATVIVPAGLTSATFTVTTLPVITNTNVTISATYNGNTLSVTLTVTAPPALSSLALSPTSVVGSKTSAGTVTLTQAAPSGGATLSLSSANISAATVPASVAVAAGSTTATFTVNTSAVAITTTVAITATYNAINKSATLTVNPPALSTMTLSPTSVVGGSPSTGTVTLTGTAPLAGVTVGLTSSNTAVATLPATVTLAAGSTSATFTITTSRVTTATTSTISATLSGVTSSATLTVTPNAPLAIDKTVSTDRSAKATSITSPTFSTVSPNELLLAFVSADANPSGGVTVTGVTGAGLTWSLVRRTNTQLGTAEIWRAFAPATLTNVSVVARLSQNQSASMTVVTFSGVDTSGTGGSGAIGATASANANAGAPSASLITTRDNSWVFAVGNDWDNAVARSLGPNQTMVHQYLATVGDTYWVQSQTSTTPLAGTVVTINDTAPTTDRYNLSICEILKAR